MEQRGSKPEKEKTKIDNIQKECDQKNQKSSKNAKNKYSRKHSQSTLDVLKMNRRKSRESNGSLLASSQIMRV